MSQKTNDFFAIRAEGIFTDNGSGKFDGNFSDGSDAALIYAASGLTINCNPILPVKCDISGNPIRDQDGRLVLLDNAVTVASNYTTLNVSTQQYANLIPPQVVEHQTVDVPSYNDIKQRELSYRIPPGTSPVTFSVQRHPLNTDSDWTKYFPASGTSQRPTVVQVTDGGLNIPANVNLSNTIIIVEQGDINFNGNEHHFNNVLLVTNAGNVHLNTIQSIDLSILASGSINLNREARFGGFTLLANGDRNGNIIFNGATLTTDNKSILSVICQGDITYNNTANTQALFLSARNFTANRNSTIIGSIGAKGNITFNAQVTVIAANIRDRDTTPPVISAQLEHNTAPGGTLTSDPTIVGRITDTSQIVEFKAGFDNTPTSAYVSILNELQADGSFRLSRDRLTQIYGSILPDGQHTLYLQATDQYGNVALGYKVMFVLDSQIALTVGLDPLFDSIPIGDRNTILTTVSLSGKTDPGATVVLKPVGATITADSTGKFTFSNVSLVIGENRFTIQATDAAGNQNTVNFTVNRLSTNNLGTIRGTVWHDQNRNGILDTNLVQGSNPDIVFVIDISGSTGVSSINWTQANLEELYNSNTLSILDTEKAAVAALTQQLVQVGRGNTRLSLVVFNDGAEILDVAPGSGLQWATKAGADLNQNGTLDILEVLNFSSVGGTNFTIALQAAETVFSSLGTKPENANLIFLSDGFGALDETVVDQLRQQGINLKAFGIGVSAGLEVLQKIDPKAIRILSARDILNIFTGKDGRYLTESGLANIKVYLDLNNNSVLDANEPAQLTQIDNTTTTTNEAGQYSFSNLPPGEYILRLEVPSGYTQTAPNGGTYHITITSAGELFDYRNFGLA